MLRAEITESLTSLLIFVRTQTTFICVSLQLNSIHHKRGRQNYLICCFVLDSYIWLVVNTQWNKEWHDLCQVEKIVRLTGLNLAVAWFCGAHHSRERLLFSERKRKTPTRLKRQLSQGYMSCHVTGHNLRSHSPLVKCQISMMWHLPLLQIKRQLK